MVIGRVIRCRVVLLLLVRDIISLLGIMLLGRFARARVGLRILVVLNGLLFARCVGRLLLHVMAGLGAGRWLNVVLDRVNCVRVMALFIVG